MEDLHTSVGRAAQTENTPNGNAEIWGEKKKTPTYRKKNDYARSRPYFSELKMASFAKPQGETLLKNVLISLNRLHGVLGDSRKAYFAKTAM